MQQRLFIQRRLLARCKSLCILFFITLIFSQACSKFVEVDTPTTQISSPVVFASDATAQAALSGIYSRMMPLTPSFSSGVITLNTGLAGDEMINYSTSATTSEFYKNSIIATNASVKSMWTEAYQLIYHANAVLEGVQQSDKLSTSLRQQITGEINFIRAFCYFYLVNLWGDVPLITTTDYQFNSAASRVAKKDVYAFIVQSLESALTQLPESYPSAERVRPNRWSAQALLARVYLYQGLWQQAETIATSLINASPLYSLETDPGAVFLKNSKETIWQLMPVQPGYNTSEASAFIFSGTPPVTALNPHLISAFDSADKRKAKWTGFNNVAGNLYYYPFRYKAVATTSITEYYVVLRLAEQYLIRSESRIQQNKVPEGVADLNIIRQRAGLVAMPTSLSKEEALKLLLRERKLELFAEWGHRWFDLKRTNSIDTTLAAIKSGWQTTDALFPIPQTEIQNAPQLTQNPGY